jgi:hypothetical protein
MTQSQIIAAFVRGAAWTLHASQSNVGLGPRCWSRMAVRGPSLMPMIAPVADVLEAIGSLQ